MVHDRRSAEIGNRAGKLGLDRTLLAVLFVRAMLCVFALRAVRHVGPDALAALAVAPVASAAATPAPPASVFAVAVALRAELLRVRRSAVTLGAFGLLAAFAVVRAFRALRVGVRRGMRRALLRERAALAAFAAPAASPPASPPRAAVAVHLAAFSVAAPVLARRGCGEINVLDALHLAVLAGCLGRAFHLLAFLILGQGLVGILDLRQRGRAGWAAAIARACSTLCTSSPRSIRNGVWPPIVASALIVMAMRKRSSRSRRWARLWLST